MNTQLAVGAALKVAIVAIRVTCALHSNLIITLTVFSKHFLLSRKYFQQPKFMVFAGSRQSLVLEGVIAANITRHSRALEEGLDCRENIIEMFRLYGICVQSLQETRNRYFAGRYGGLVIIL